MNELTGMQLKVGNLFQNETSPIGKDDCAAYDPAERWKGNSSRLTALAKKNRLGPGSSSPENKPRTIQGVISGMLVIADDIENAGKGCPIL